MVERDVSQDAMLQVGRISCYLVEQLGKLTGEKPSQVCERLALDARPRFVAQGLAVMAQAFRERGL